LGLSLTATENDWHIPMLQKSPNQYRTIGGFRWAVASKDLFFMVKTGVEYRKPHAHRPISVSAIQLIRPLRLFLYMLVAIDKTMKQKV
jgi:hypothetical protein